MVEESQGGSKEVIRKLSCRGVKLPVYLSEIEHARKAGTLQTKPTRFLELSSAPPAS